ncbi:hypothetical protein ABIE78_004470 [Sinorhizobium fredii]|uniref:hypothetical protein n=1 Tax=Rhizobium fredii TaxID=380 RepID=UPI00059E6FBD|nr:hypothetical protein [Sinorhizobium fredii]
MNALCNEIEAGRHALAISIWENEGGTLAPELMEHGRHIEMDRPWRIYHVSIGAPAHVDDDLRYIERRIKRISLSAPARPASRETEAR